MILDNSQTTVQTVGDIQENSIRIDQANVEHIITILSSNLYSNPVESFLRETISNAVDSHVEAGTTEPVVLSLIENGYANYTVAIRDYGTGISPERFNDIYLSIGSSTKRQSNNYIGSFGVGRFSCLAVANIVNITSFYEGKAYVYVMVKNGTKINIDLLTVTDTDEPNGVEVKVQVDNIKPYFDSIEKLYCFDNLYIHSNTNNYRVDLFNHRELTKYDTFITGVKQSSTYNKKCLLSIGSVIYEYDVSKIVPAIWRYSYESKIYERICLRFNIGDLDVTPNREQLLYSQKTLDALKTKNEAFIKEINEILDSRAEDYDDLFNWYYAYKNCDSLELANDTVLSLSGLKEFNPKSTVTLKGKFPDYEIREVIHNILSSSISSLTHHYNYIQYKGEPLKTKSVKSTALYEMLFKDSIADVHFVFVDNPDITRKVYWKQYVNKTYKDGFYIFIAKPTINKELYKYVTTHMFPGIKSNPEYRWILYKECVRAISKRGEYVDFKNLPKYKEFIENNKISRGSTTPNIGNFRAHVIIGNYTSNYTDTYPDLQTLERSIRYRNNDLPIVYTDTDDSRIDIAVSFGAIKKYIVVEFSKTTLQKFKKKMPTNWIPIEKVINGRMKEFKQYLTCRKYYPGNCNYFTTRIMLNELLHYLPIEEYKILVNLKYVPKPNVESLDKERLNIMRKEFIDAGNPYDEDIIKAVELLEYYQDRLNPIKGIYRLFQGSNASYDLLAYLAMKKKVIRINKSAYADIKRRLNEQ